MELIRGSMIYLKVKSKSKQKSREQNNPGIPEIKLARISSNQEIKLFNFS